MSKSSCFLLWRFASGIKSRLNHFPGQLSEGEQQRVAIARAIAKCLQVLRCHESTGVLEVLNHVNQAFETMAVPVLLMRSGKIVEIQENECKKSPTQLEWQS